MLLIMIMQLMLDGAITQQVLALTLLTTDGTTGVVLDLAGTTLGYGIVAALAGTTGAGAEALDGTDGTDGIAEALVGTTGAGAAMAVSDGAVMASLMPGVLLLVMAMQTRASTEIEAMPITPEDVVIITETHYLETTQE